MPHLLRTSIAPKILFFFILFSFAPIVSFAQLTISGTVTRHPAEIPEEGVTVYLSDGSSVITDENGYYAFTNLAADSNYVITPEKIGDGREGVSVIDINKIRLAILGIDTEFWDNPFNFIAGDINESGGSLANIDLILMWFAILDKESVTWDYPLEWIFHDESIPVEADIPIDPLVPFIAIDSLTENAIEQNFIVVKQGDLVKEDSLPLAAIDPIFFFERTTDCSDELTIDLKVSGFEEEKLNSFQFALNWDSTILEFVEAVPVEFYDFGTSSFLQNDGETLSVTGISFDFWFEPEDSISLIQLRFNILGAVGENTTISLDEEQLPFMAFANLGERIETELDSITVEIADVAILESDFFVQNVACNGGDDGSIEVSVSGGTAPYSYHWNTGDTTALIENLEVGTYLCTITDQGNCQFHLEEEITEPDLMAVYWSVTDASSPSASDGAIVLDSITGGTAPFSFDPSGPYIDLQPTNYTIDIIDANGCLYISNVIVSFLNGLDELEDLGIQITLFPNPVQAGQQNFLKINNPQSDFFTIKILNGIGQQVSEIESFTPAGEFDYPLNLPSEKGLYFIEISNRVGAKKIMKVVVN